MTIAVTGTQLPGILIITPTVFRDERGFFFESYRWETYAAAGIKEIFVQDNHSRSIRNVLRGFHYQAGSPGTCKLVRCTVGAIHDIVVDLRVSSPTFGRFFSTELSAEDPRQLFLPVGLAHGFLALSEVAEVQYKSTSPYQPEYEGTIRWDDPDIGADWPTRSPILSSRDRAGSTLEQYLRAPAFVGGVDGPQAGASAYSVED